MTDLTNRRIILGPLFTTGLALGMYGAVRRRRGVVAVAALLLLADRTPAARRVAEARLSQA